MYRRRTKRYAEAMQLLDFEETERIFVVVSD